MLKKKKSKKQEERIAKQIGGKTVIASGALWSCKADVRNDKYLVEAKYTDTNYYTLNVRTWNKIAQEAIKDGLRVPVMCIDIKKKSYAVLRVDDFIFLNKGKALEGMLHKKAKSVRLSYGMPFGYHEVHFGDIELSIIPWDYFLDIQNNIMEV